MQLVKGSNRRDTKMTGQLENTELAGTMTAVHNDIMAHIGITDAQLEKLMKLSQEEVILGASKDITFKLNVKNGKGHQSVSQTTAWVTISGSFEITSPDEGTWDIVVKDGSHTILNKKGVKKGDKISFKHKTGFKANISLDVTWSEAKDTTLEAKIHASY
jgi:hypothetical protein